MHISAVLVLDFLTELYNSGLGYSALGSAKAAILNFVTLTSGSSLAHAEPIFHKFMRGVFARRPALPRYGVTWDVDIVLRYLKSQSPPDALGLRALSCKLATLLVLLTGHRGQSIHSLNLQAITCSANRLVLRFDTLLKTSRPGKHMSEVVLPAFDQEPGLCVVRTYKAYITRTKRYRKSKGKLFIITIKPFTPISRDAFGHWIRHTLAKAGIDLGIFGCHTCRGAATSKVKAAGVPLATIIKTAGWESSNTFRKFYDRPINRSVEFASTVLEAGMDSNTGSRADE